MDTDSVLLCTFKIFFVQEEQRIMICVIFIDAEPRRTARVVGQSNRTSKRAQKEARRIPYGNWKFTRTTCTCCKLVCIN